MIPDALKPAICTNCRTKDATLIHTAELYGPDPEHGEQALSGEWWKRCLAGCGGSGLNPDMIREVSAFKNPRLVHPPGRYVVIPLENP